MLAIMHSIIRNIENHSFYRGVLSQVSCAHYFIDRAVKRKAMLDLGFVEMYPPRQFLPHSIMVFAPSIGAYLTYLPR